MAYVAERYIKQRMIIKRLIRTATGWKQIAKVAEKYPKFCTSCGKQSFKRAW